MGVKKKIVSMMLALTLVFSEIPAYTANAAENPSDNVEYVEEDGTETSKTEEDESTQFTDTQNTETENTNQSDAEEQNTEAAQTENTGWEVKTEIKTAAVERPISSADNEIVAFHVAENGKAVGSDGVLYEDVVYLSADTVRALDEDIQTVYFEVCDSIAELKAQEDALNGAVIAVDEEGNLHYSISVPTKRLAERSLFREKTDSTVESSTQEVLKGSSEKTDLIEETVTKKSEEVSTETEATENNSVENSTSKETESKEVSSEETSTIDESTEKVSSEEETLSTEETSIKEETSVKEETSSMEETSKQETSVEETTASEENTEQDTTESFTTEETTEEETAEEGTVSEEESSEETELTNEVLSIEDVTEADTTELEIIETETEEYVFAAENMELLEYGEEETFEVVDNVKVEPIVDMGYGFDTDFAQFNSTLKSKTYFKNQLDSVEKKIYDAGVNKLTKGTNQFEYAYPIEKINDDYNSAMIHKRTFQAVSAIIMQYPYDMDWMDLSSEGETTIGVGVYEGTNYLTGKLRLTLGIAPYYSADLVNKANNKVFELAEKAQRYAMENYPNDIVYGVVKYMDDWICENNYYDMIGVTGGNAGDSPAEKEAYYYCHSSYGILLKGFGVCESYALAMTRLLDALGIPNMYATGYAGTPTNGGGHAWNYVQMPDNKWYLQDSTWNDDTNPAHTVSYGDYLLCADDGMHLPQGSRWILNNGDFTFVDVNNTNYDVSKGGIFETKAYNLNLKDNKTIQLNVNDTYGDIYKPVFTSSNTKVAKVDKKGKITAVSAGKTNITVAYNLNGVQIKDTCTVNVCAVKNLTFERTNKTSDTLSLGMNAKAAEKEVVLLANCGDDNYDVESMISQKFMEVPVITQPKSKDIATITFDRAEGNKIVLKVVPKQQGANASYKIALGGKTVTLKVSVGENLIDRSWFKIDADYIVDGKTPYTGKALKPKVVKNTEASDIPSDLKFKATYFDNKDAGTASIVVSGTGKYAGEETFEFEIQSLPITEGNVITANIKAAQNIAYNGAVNQAKATVKYKNGKTKLTLKAGVDYDIVYKMNGTETTTTPKQAGTYSVVGIRGKGNFNGEYAVPNATYTIKSNSLKKAKVTFTPDNEAIVKFGKNELSSTEYTVEYYKDKNCTEKLSAKPRIKGTYYVMVRPSDVSKNNLTDEKMVTLKVK